MRKDKSFHIVIRGEVPAKKNSYRFGARGLYKPASITEFEKLVYWELKEKKAPLLHGKISISLSFFTATNGDLDNKITTMLDALQDNGAGGLFENDRDVVSIVASKIKCSAGEEPCVSVEVSRAS